MSVLRSTRQTRGVDMARDQRPDVHQVRPTPSSLHAQVTLADPGRQRRGPPPVRSAGRPPTVQSWFRSPGVASRRVPNQRRSVKERASHWLAVVARADSLSQLLASAPHPRPGPCGHGIPSRVNLDGAKNRTAR